MSSEVEQLSQVEHGVLNTIPATTSASSTSSPKISIFAAKSGFVIPRNKLSGSLIPIVRGGKKLGISDVEIEETTKQIQRKTRWGPDLTKDASVRKGRALAYQIRVEQITQQLKSGILESGDDQDLPLPSHDSLGHRISDEKSELLELERREAIGEILKLNPSYKAPSDYKPLLKEDKVPIPIKEYPGYNFIAVIFGPGSNNQKRLEKETGAKIRVFGTKADVKKEREISASDGQETHADYEEMHVRITADTYEKVDAAVSLVELLVAPVSVKSGEASTMTVTVSGGGTNAIMGQGTTAPITISPLLANQSEVQPLIGPGQVPVSGQFQTYPTQWYPSGPPPGFVTPPFPTTSAPVFRNTIQASPSPNAPSLFVPRPVFSAGFGLNPQSSVVPPRPQTIVQVSQPIVRGSMPAPPTNPSYPPLLPRPGQSNFSASPPFANNPSTPAGPTQNLGPSVSFAFPARPLNGSPVNLPFPPSASQPSPVSQQLGPRQVIPNLTQNPMFPIPSPAIASMSPPPPPLVIPASLPGSSPSFTPIRNPSVMVQKPQNPASSDFTFQPHRPQASSQVIPRPGNQPQIVPPPNPLLQPPQSPSVRPGITNPVLPPVVQSFQRPQLGSQMSPSPSQLPMNAPPPRYPSFPGPVPGPVASAASLSQMGPRQFVPAHQSGPFLSRPGGNVPAQQGYPSIGTTQPPHMLAPMNQQFGGNAPFTSGRLTATPTGTQQIYDPFSPTSVSPARPPVGGNPPNRRKQESDPEYEDLMASVGVK